MDREMLELLMQHHAYKVWQGRNSLNENLFVWRFFLGGNELAGWQAHRIQAMAAAGWPPSLRSIWKRPGEGALTLLNVETFECASRKEAHEFAIRLLGEFESPQIGLDKQVGVGDVAFVVPGGTAILFARANLVVLVRNAGRDLVPVTETAGGFDGNLVSKPQAAAGMIVPEIRIFRSPGTEFRVGANVPLEVEAKDPLDRPVWYKFFSRSGEVFAEEGRLVYRPASAGEQAIRVFAVNANQGVVSQELKLTAR